MNILGIDTSSILNTSIGIYFSNEEKMEINISTPCSQEEKLLFSINSALEIMKKDMNDIDIFAIGLGPGSFTGLRIGLATIKGLAWSLNKKIIGFSSLELLVNSLNYIDDNILLVPLIYAKMNRLYSALFNGKHRITEDMDIEPEKLISKIQEFDFKKVVILTPESLNKYEDIFNNSLSNKELKIYKYFFISGLKICEYVINSKEIKFTDIKTIQPIYLRKSEAEINYEKNQIKT